MNTSQEDTTPIKDFFKDYKIHHKDLDICFNDAVAVHHIEQAIQTYIDNKMLNVLDEVAKANGAEHSSTVAEKLNYLYATIKSNQSKGNDNG